VHDAAPAPGLPALCAQPLLLNMFRCLLALCFLTGVAVVQTSFADLAAIGPVRPDFILAVAVFLTLTFGLRQVFVLVWCLGILRDVYSAGPVGMYALVFLAVGLMVDYVRAYAFRDNPGIAFAAAFGAVMVCNLLAALVLSFQYTMPPSWQIIRESLLSGVYCAAIVLILPRVLGRPCRWLGLGRAR